VVVSDVDGTLIDSEGRLPAENIEALQAVQERGLRVLLATIRKHDTANQIAEQLGIECGLVCEGGATAYDADGSLVRTVSLPLEVAMAIATLADDRGFPLATTVDAVNYFGPGYEPSLLFGAASFVETNRSVLTTSPTRMVIRSEDAVDFIARELAEAPLHIVRHYRAADRSFIDGVITHRDANKAAAVEALLDRWGLSWDVALAIGDAEADLGMIQQARIGVAMGNATPAIQAAADYISGLAAESGVAQAIQRFVLSSN